MSRAPHSHLTRTCPWCADATVIAFTEEGLIRALARHLERCAGEETGEGS